MRSFVLLLALVLVSVMVVASMDEPPYCDARCGPGSNTCKCIQDPNSTLTVVHYYPTQGKEEKEKGEIQFAVAPRLDGFRRVCIGQYRLLFSYGSCSPMPSPFGSQCASYGCNECGPAPMCSCYDPPTVQNEQLDVLNCTLLPDHQLLNLLHSNFYSPIVNDL
jgi:hypothetical protein